jgi:DNA helicase MCM8
MVCVSLRIDTFSQSQPFVSINAENVEKMVHLTGAICRVGSKRPYVDKMCYECTKCRETVIQTITDNIYRRPSKCRGNCKSKSFNLIQDSSDFRCRDMQEIKIQEILPIEGNEGNMGKVPLTVNCILFDDLVGVLAPGDVIQLIGIVKAEQEGNVLYKLVIHVNNFRVLKNKNNFVEELGCSKDDMDTFKKMARSKSLFSSLINSLYQMIYGNELI